MIGDAPEELNLTPYLDVLMNLIVFVLDQGAAEMDAARKAHFDEVTLAD